MTVILREPPSPYGDGNPGDVANDIPVEDKRPQFFMTYTAFFDDYGHLVGPFGIAVYVALCRYAGKRQQSWVGVRTIAKNIGCSDRQVQKELAALRDLGLVGIEERKRETSFGGLAQATNLYSVLPLPVVSPDAPSPRSVEPPPVNSIHRDGEQPSDRTRPSRTRPSEPELAKSPLPNSRSPREGRPPSARTSATPRTGGDRGPEKVATRATTASGSPTTPGPANPMVSQQPAKQPGGVPSDEALLLVRWWQEQTQKPVEETYRQQHVDAAEALIEKAGCADEARAFIAWRVSQGWSTDLRYMPAKYIPGWRDMLLGIPKHGKPRGGGLTLDRDGFRPGDTPEMLERYANAF